MNQTEKETAEELQQAVRSYLAASAEMYANAIVEAQRARLFLADAETALIRLNAIAKQLGGNVA